MALLWLLPAAALACALFCGYSARQLIRSFLLLPERHDESWTRELELAHHFDEALRLYDEVWPREAFTLENEGAALSGEIIPAPRTGERAKLVIVGHGHTVNRISSLKYARIFRELGYTVVLYDQRSFGRSTGDFCTLGEREARDLAAIAAMVKARFGEDCFLGLHGESMGAATALQALRLIRPAFVAADCPFADTEQLIRELVRKQLHVPAGLILPLLRAEGRRRFGYDPRRVCPREAVRASSVPVCLMHGEADTLIAPAHSESILSASRNPLSRLHLFPGADHAESIVVDRERYEALLTAFVRDVEKEQTV